MALKSGVPTKTHVLNLLHRLVDGKSFTPPTIDAPQALTLLNDAIVLGFAKTFAARVVKDAGDDADKAIDRAFTLALGRQPDTEERAATRSFLKGHKGPFPDAVADLCHALLNLNEFLYVD